MRVYDIFPASAGRREAAEIGHESEFSRTQQKFWFAGYAEWFEGHESLFRSVFFWFVADA